MSGCRCDTRSWDRNDVCCCDRSRYCSRCRAGRRNESRIRGKHSPYRLGDRTSRGPSQRAKAKRQNAKRRNRRKGKDLEHDGRGEVRRQKPRAKSQDRGRGTMNDVRCTNERTVLRFEVAASLTSANERFSARVSRSTYTICGSETWSGPQFCRPPLGPQAAYPVAFADTARDTLKPAMTGALTRTSTRTMTQTMTGSASGTMSRAMPGAVTD
jgi:hypothetical protein